MLFPCAVKTPLTPEQMALFIAQISLLLPISSAQITFGAIERISILIPLLFEILSNISVLIPKSFWGIPLYNEPISPLSSTTETLIPLKPIFAIPLLMFLIKSLKIVVFPFSRWRNN